MQDYMKIEKIGRHDYVLTYPKRVEGEGRVVYEEHPVKLNLDFLSSGAWNCAFKCRRTGCVYLLVPSVNHAGKDIMCMDSILPRYPKQLPKLDRIWTEFNYDALKEIYTVLAGDLLQSECSELSTTTGSGTRYEYNKGYHDLSLYKMPFYKGVNHCPSLWDKITDVLSEQPSRRLFIKLPAELKDFEGFPIKKSTLTYLNSRFASHPEDEERYAVDISMSNIGLIGDKTLVIFDPLVEVDQVLKVNY